MIFIPFFVGKKAISLGEDNGPEIGRKNFGPGLGTPIGHDGGFERRGIAPLLKDMFGRGGK